MRYLDTGSRDLADTLYEWLHHALIDATYFGCQTGYFSYDGMFPLEQRFLDLLNRSGEIHLVVGANEGGIRKVDLEDVLDLFEKAPGSTHSSLVLVAADDVLMHPKTYYIEQANGTKHAFIGSANLTHSGLGRNIEAAITVDSTNDPAAPFAAFRRAVDKWRLKDHPNAHLVSRTSLGELVDRGVIGHPTRTPSPVPPEARRNRATTFPVLGAILKLPRKKRTPSPATPVTQQATAPVPIGTLSTLPVGVIGIIKRLSALDTKGFHGGTGTLYIALPLALAEKLPMAPYGSNSEPRIEVSVEARLDTVAGEVVLSGPSPTNITHVGSGSLSSSHSDLRFNYLTTVNRGIQNLAAEFGVEVPQPEDLVTIELLEGVRARVTFITDQASIINLMPLLTQSSSWGWLPTSTSPPWDDNEDDA